MSGLVERADRETSKQKMDCIHLILLLPNLDGSRKIKTELGTNSATAGKLVQQDGVVFLFVGAWDRVKAWAVPSPASVHR